MSQWISIAYERKPPAGKRVLIRLSGNKIASYGELGKDGFWYRTSLKFPYEYSICKQPTHWMPLPIFKDEDK